VFLRILRRARSTSTAGSRSPLISASIMSRADKVVSAEATESILIPPSSRTFARRCNSLVRCSMSFLRYRVNSRIAAICGGGMKLPRSSPHSVNSASHIASRASLLRPGTFLTCRALTSSTSSGRSASHRAWNTGFQYTPVASMVTCVMRSEANQATILISAW
jgi:hypothetical protein